MNRSTRKIFWAGLLAGGLPLFGLCGATLAQDEAGAQEEPAAELEAADGDLARQAYEFRERYCHRCHISDGGAPQFDLLNLEVITDKNRKPPLLVPGKPEDSMLWQRVDENLLGGMPPAEEQQPTAEELAMFKSWIVAGAPDYSHERPFVSEKDLLTGILKDLLELNSEDQKHQRYYSIAHLHNNTSLNEFTLRLHRAAMSKAINSMSQSPDIVEPKVVPGTQDTLYRIDLREVGWEDPEKWLAVLDKYPYGMEWNDSDLRRLHKRVLQEFENAGAINVGVPYIRADWFVDKATRPPVYNVLLDLPDTLAELESDLGINVERDFNNNQLKRAGFSQSGVSRHNRLVDRHQGRKTKYYYRSYDFGKSSGKGVLFRFPLGPVFTNGRFTNQAFEADGGEFVWQLANGMQGYYIADKDGKKLDVAPVQIVRDLNEIAGSPEVVTGISCMGCHNRGVVTYRDSIRGGFVGTGDARTKVESLYIPSDQMDRIINKDIGEFLAALDLVIGPFLREGGSQDQSIEELVKLPEPIRVVAKLYNQEMGLEEVARELGFENVQELGLQIKGSQQLQENGLGPLSKNQKIVREMWDSQEDNGVSLYQKTAQDMGLGTPLTF